MSEIFVSPGIYVREYDFSYYVSSVGETSLAIVGETLKGPAFEPTLVSSVTEFNQKFGLPSQTKMAGYCAKSYFKYANQAYIVRVLGEEALRGNHDFLPIRATVNNSDPMFSQGPLQLWPLLRV